MLMEVEAKLTETGGIQKAVKVVFTVIYVRPKEFRVPASVFLNKNLLARLLWQSRSLNKWVCLPGGLNKWIRFTQGWGALLRRVFGTSGWEQESFMTRCLNHQEEPSWIQHLSGVSNCDLMQPHGPIVSPAGPLAVSPAFWLHQQSTLLPALESVFAVPLCGGCSPYSSAGPVLLLQQFSPQVVPPEREPLDQPTEVFI